MNLCRREITVDLCAKKNMAVAEKSLATSLDLYPGELYARAGIILIFSQPPVAASPNQAQRLLCLSILDLVKVQGFPAAWTGGCQIIIDE
jgi:hypothetical protein